jgi:hypothetical protein
MARPRRTATIERYHLYGTSRMVVRLMYRGSTVNWHEGLNHVFAQAAFDDAEAIEQMKTYARKQGFTHVKYEGDWTNRTKPAGGKL